MKLQTALKNLDTDTVKEIEAMDPATLKKRVVEANQAMQQVANELEENEQYQQLKESLKAVTLGKKEVDKRQKSVITVCLAMLSDKGE